MHLKHTLLALSAAGMLTSQAYASEAQVEAAIQPAQPVAAFSEADMASLFDNANQPMQMVALSPQEMRETEGAFTAYNWLGAGAGALGGHWGYMAGSSYGRSYNRTAHLVAIGMGAIGGFANPTRSIGAVAWGLGFGTVSGGLQGWAGSRGTTYRW